MRRWPTVPVDEGPPANPVLDPETARRLLEELQSGAARGGKRELKPIDGAAATLRRLSARGIRIRIITHRLYIKYFHEETVRQTTQWLERHGIPYWDLCFMKDKAAVGADLYIEDSPQNVEQLRADGHPTIVFSNSTNTNVASPRADTWAEAEKLVLAALEKWMKKHQEKEISGR